MPVRVLCAGPPSESGGFHKQPCLKEYAACSAAFTLARAMPADGLLDQLFAEPSGKWAYAQ